FGVFLFVLIGPLAFTQGPGGGGKRGGGWGNFDMSAWQKKMFDNLSDGKDNLVIADMKFKVNEKMLRWSSEDQQKDGFEKQKELLNSYLQEKGITNGQMNFDQYKDYSKWVQPKQQEYYKTLWAKGGFGKGGGGKGGGGLKMGGGKTGAGSPASPQDLDGQAR